MKNINDNYFEGQYKDIWKAFIPVELTNKEIEFMVQYFELEPGKKVLDLMCGYGRHAIGLAEKGIMVTAVDNLKDYIEEIESEVTAKELPIKLVLTNVALYEPDDMYDLVICMGNSLNFFDEAAINTLFRNISNHLLPGGNLLINTWSIAEISIRNFKDKAWNLVGDLRFLTDARYLFHPSRIETETTIIAPDGGMETKMAIDYIFSIAEIEKMLGKAGLKLKEIYSVPGRKKFDLGEPRAYIIAEKLG